MEKKTSNNKITVGAALRQLAALKGKIAKSTVNALNAVQYPENEKPVFKYQDEQTKRTELIKKFVDLSAAVAESNGATRIDCGDDIGSISAAKLIRILQETKGEIAYLKNVGTKALGTKKVILEQRRDKREDIVDANGRFSGQRIVEVIEQTTIVSEITTKEVAEKIEELEAKFERLNMLLEKSNHTTLIQVD